MNKAWQSATTCAKYSAPFSVLGHLTFGNFCSCAGRCGSAGRLEKDVKVAVKVSLLN